MMCAVSGKAGFPSVKINGQLIYYKIEFYLNWLSGAVSHHLVLNSVFKKINKYDNRGKSKSL